MIFKITFSLAYFTVSIQLHIHNIKSTMLSIMLPVNSGLLVVKFHRSQKLPVDFGPLWGWVPLTPGVVQGSPVFQADMRTCVSWCHLW